MACQSSPAKQGFLGLVVAALVIGAIVLTVLLQPDGHVEDTPNDKTNQTGETYSNITTYNEIYNNITETEQIRSSGLAVSQPYPRNGNTDEKLSKNVDLKYFNNLNKKLGQTWAKGGQTITFSGSQITLQDTKTFIPNMKTVFMSHGYASNAEGDNSCEAFVEKYQSAGRNVQVICIDWRNLAKLGLAEEARHGGLYNGEAQNCIDVGWWLGRLLHSLVKKTGLDVKQVHLIGHSLGAHVVGTMGRTFTSLSRSKVGRITGLDPAGPLFVRNKYGLKKHMISKNDGTFVDIIHTNGDFNPYAFNLLHLKDSFFLGDLHALGHADFYPNGGQRQGASGCKISAGACSHGRAVLYYLHSILDGSRAYPSFPCSSAETCSKGMKTSGKLENNMGEFARKPPGRAQKQYYLQITTNYGPN